MYQKDFHGHGDPLFMAVMQLGARKIASKWKNPRQEKVHSPQDDKIPTTKQDGQEPLASVTNQVAKTGYGLETHAHQGFHGDPLLAEVLKVRPLSSIPEHELEPLDTSDFQDDVMYDC